MMKKLVMFCLLGLFLVTSVGLAEAFVFSGEKCWQLVPYNGHVRLSISKVNNEYRLNGVNVESGTTHFLTGTAVKSPSANAYKLALTQISPSGDCFTFLGSIDAFNGSGPGSNYTCSGTPIVTVTWTPIACPAGLVP